MAPWGLREGVDAQGKTVGITGGASGFGRLVAQRVAELGGNAVVGDVNEAGLAETVSSRVTDR